jgi:hypothetical protein
MKKSSRQGPGRKKEQAGSLRYQNIAGRFPSATWKPDINEK